MKVDTNISNISDILRLAEISRGQEAAGYDALWTSETNHDPFLPLALAAGNTERVELGTSIAVAFARNPMLLANIGWDLQALSKGRFIMGLGSQIKPHITKRFSMPWSAPAARMREMISAVRAIWSAWLTGDRLNFRGEYYTHTLMTEFFSPDASELANCGPPKIFLAGVGKLMTGVAGEVCDGFICHGFTTEKYLREVSLPALSRGRATVGKTLAGFEISSPCFVVSGRDEKEMAKSAQATREQIAFYGSTPAYRGVLELHGWGELQDDLNLLSKQGRWAEMGSLIDDEILGTFAVVAEPGGIASELGRRFGDIITRLTFYAPGQSDPEFWNPVMSALKRL